MAVNVGDWVRSYSSGIWQIDRILEYRCLDPLTGQEAKKTTVFSRRFVSNSFKRSFSEEACDPIFVKLLGTDELATLQDFIAQNTELHEKFRAHEWKGIDCVFNARIAIPGDRNLAAATAKLAGAGPMRDVEISPFLESMGFDTKTRAFWTAQFVSPNFECRDGYLMFKFLRVLSS